MLSRVDAVSKDDVFLPLSRRKERGVYFLRLDGYSEAVKQYIWRYHEEARQRAGIVATRFSNPDDRQRSH